MKPNITRSAVAALALSAAGFAAWVTHEGYTGRAIQPVPGDKWTAGFGSTVHIDGTPVKPGDTLTPPAAVRLAIADLAGKESALRACLDGARLLQYEWDAFVSLSGNVGTGAVCRSSIPGKLQSGQYAAACKTILDFRRVQKRDCSRPENKRFCGGVWTRRQDEYRMCAEGVYP
jgi:lysozyme